MLRERRRGRPSVPPGVAPCNVTSRLRRLVDDVHDGNLLQASAHAGVPYAILREIHAGRCGQPGHETLERIARAYGLPAAWFVEGSAVDDGTIPLAGWVATLPGAAGGRRVTIPIGAWPLIRVLVFLEQRLRDQPASPERPIIGAATDPREIRRRLTAFVLQPLLAARSIAGLPLEAASETATVGAGPWVDMLRDLGCFWERALVGVFPELGMAAPFARPDPPFRSS